MIGEMVRRRRLAAYGTKSDAYRAAGLNSATWDRIEQGLGVRDDRLAAVVRTLWPSTGGDWRAIPSGEESAPVFGGSYDDPGYLAHVEGWVRELQERVEQLEEWREKTGELQAGEKTPAPPERQDDARGGSVTPLPRAARRGQMIDDQGDGLSDP